MFHVERFFEVLHGSTRFGWVLGRFYGASPRFHAVLRVPGGLSCTRLGICERTSKGQKLAQPVPLGGLNRPNSEELGSTPENLEEPVELVEPEEPCGTRKNRRTV
jgi:hypothetical protein